MKRSIRAVTTGSGTEPSSSTPSWNARILNLKLAHSPTCSSLPSRLYLDHSHGPVLAPATQLRCRLPARLKLVCFPAHSPLSTAALPSMSLSPSAPFLHSRRVLCRSRPRGSIETRSLPTLTRSYPRRFTFYVADPVSSIETRSLPTLTRSYPRRFTFHVADPMRSIQPPLAAASKL